MANAARKSRNAVRTVDLTGLRFGKWNVLHRVPSPKVPVSWVCHCDCGRTLSVLGANLRRGLSKGCRYCFPLPIGVASLRGLLNSYKKGARKRALVWELSEDQFRALTSSDCHFCGQVPTRVWMRGDTNGHYLYNGIDRKDPTLGYTVENCLPSCWTCNSMKSARGYDEFIEHVRRIVWNMPEVPR